MPTSMNKCLHELIVAQAALLKLVGVRVDLQMRLTIFLALELSNQEDKHLIPMPASVDQKHLQTVWPGWGVKVFANKM